MKFTLDTALIGGTYSDGNPLPFKFEARPFEGRVSTRQMRAHHAEVRQWMKANLRGPWDYSSSHAAYVLDERDATLFRIRWC